MTVIILKIGYKKTIEELSFKNFSHHDLLYFDFSTIVPSQFGQHISYPLPYSPKASSSNIHSGTCSSYLQSLHFINTLFSVCSVVERQIA